MAVAVVFVFMVLTPVKVGQKDDSCGYARYIATAVPTFNYT
jgi:hypothetical protein